MTTHDSFDIAHETRVVLDALGLADWNQFVCRRRRHQASADALDAIA